MGTIRRAVTLRVIARAYASVGLVAALIGCSSHHAGDQAASSGAGSGFDNSKAATGGRGAQGTAAHAGSGMSAGAAEECMTLKATRTCCGTGTQTCMGQVEFATWGPCLDSGKVLTCDGTDTCAKDEFGHCDAGVPFDSGTHCGAGEFGPNCDGSVPPPPSLCKDKNVNTEPEILAGYSPASGESVAKDGEIKVWVTDEAAAIIAPNEQIDATTGLITMPGDRTAKAPDGYLWEPALYIAPATAESGGKPYFPTYIRGWSNNMIPPQTGKPPRGLGTQNGTIETPPAGVMLTEKYDTEDVWEVGDLGLAPGTYEGEFVIHDGDRDRAIGCVTITITP